MTHSLKSKTEKIAGLSFEDYWDWYDNGPGSEKWKRELREQMKPVKFPNVPGFSGFKEKTASWPEWKIKAAEAAVGFKIKRKKEENILEDELFEI